MVAKSSSRAAADGIPALTAARVSVSTNTEKYAGAVPTTAPSTSSWSSRMTAARPRAPKIWTARSTSCLVALGPAATAEAPESTCTQRLGITRTTRAPGSAASMAEMGTPAAMETTSLPASASAHSAMTPGST